MKVVSNMCDSTVLTEFTVSGSKITDLKFLKSGFFHVGVYCSC